jgi:glycosyltransferase involved in cell wall biosynthesis
LSKKIVHRYIIKSIEKLKILHICNWYPNRENPYEALWIQRHVEALEPFIEQEIWHLQVRLEKNFNYQKYQDKVGVQHQILDIPLKQWFFVEILSSLLLFFLLIRKSRKFDLINVHIAYPLLTHWYILKYFFKKPIVVTEHWSAYHLNFGLPKESRKLNRIKIIFRQNIKLITVSKALLKDIKEFSGNSNLNSAIIPNIVDTDIFKPDPNKQESKGKLTFFMVSSWAYPKDPITIILAFAEILKKYDYISLEIGGYGSLIQQMQEKVKLLKLDEKITFLGKMDASAIAKKQQSSTAFIHCSGYETFSVVCAEALCCGQPVIASNVGGIMELINRENGILVHENTVEAWVKALSNFIEKNNYNRDNIASVASKRFNIKAVGERYYETLIDILD